MSDIIKDIKKYNMETAQRWKIESRKLLLKYKNDKSGFEKILHYIVGTGGGGILRDVAVTYFPDFSNYIFENFPIIEKGLFDIFSVKSFPDKKPKSFVSKICHIINPKDYLVIYDNYIKDALKIKENKHLKENWDNAIYEFKKKQTGTESIKDLYAIDSELWAQGSVQNIN